jgi:hypothetical protein
MGPKIKPIFLFSLPRSGSTLVQRVLAAHHQIATVSEPWIMLPMLGARKLEGTFADYSHLSTYYAINDFINSLPGQESAYRAELKDFFLNLYQRAADPGATYFLDKTPRYHSFAHEIIQIFGEDAHYVFLWRNPLSVIASLIEMGNGKWNLYQYKIDLYQGLDNLIRTWQTCQVNAISINYESLVRDRMGTEWEKLFAYLDLKFSPAYLSEFSEVQLTGTAGDILGMKQYRSISDAPLEKWKTTLSNPMRKRWAKNYLRWIGNKRLSGMGYSLSDLMETVDSVHGSWHGVPADVGRMVVGELRCVFSLRSIYYNLRKVSDLKKIFSVEY